MPNKIVLNGSRFGRLIVLREGGSRRGRLFWLCRCDCGNEKAIDGWSLRRGATVSCGCFERESRSTNARTHGHSADGGTRTFHIWNGMLARCYNQNNPAFKDYGGLLPKSRLTIDGNGKMLALLPFGEKRSTLAHGLAINESLRWG
jgi:hypothetical protein